jgi:hypothetical protein
MALRHLRTVRVVTSLLLFLPALFLFTDLTGVLPPAAVAAFTSVQLVPGIVKLFSGLALSAAGLAWWCS